MLAHPTSTQLTELTDLIVESSSGSINKARRLVHTAELRADALYDGLPGLDGGRGVDRDLCALSRERPCDGGADATGGSGDEGDPTLEIVGRCDGWRRHLSCGLR